MVAVVAGAFGPDVRAEGETAANPFRAVDYVMLRKELRAFYPDWGQGDQDVVRDPRQPASVKAIEADLTAYCAAHPDYDALDVRRECYLSMRKHFVPFLFGESPFYFEAGVNGGWGGARPARLVEKICWHFYKTQSLIPDEAFELQQNRERNCLALCCGTFSDSIHHTPPLTRILEIGFKGVRDRVADALEKCPADDPHGRKELETALVGLDTIHEIQLKFAEEARRLLAARGRAGNVSGAPRAPEEGRRLERIAEAAQRCPWEPPRTFFEKLNTLWFVREALGYVDGVSIFALGRPDAWFMDDYRREIAAGTLTKKEARELVAKFLVTADCHYDGLSSVHSYNDHEVEIPLTLGGCDPDGKPVWNELTEMFLDAHLGADCVYPKLHCRVSADSPQAYLEKIGAMVIAGHSVFALLNDDRKIQNYLDMDMGWDLRRVRNYIGVGCWNGSIDSASNGDGGYVSIEKILELSIHRDPAVEKACKLKIDPLEDATNFEELRDIMFRNTIRFLRSLGSEYARHGRACANVNPYPVYTMCLDGGIESRRDTQEGGTRRNCGLTLGFLGNVVDSLCAIDRLCFVDKVCTVKELFDVVRSNWAGPRGEELRRRALEAPYWGDGSAQSTGLMAWFMRNTVEGMDGLVSSMGGRFFFQIYTYREFMYWGDKTKATPDGRRNGEQLAQGFTPSELRCRTDASTVMNAIGELPNGCLTDSNANLTFDRDGMTAEVMAAIFRVFAQKGSHLMQPNCNSVELLLDAQKHPERHQNLIVKVCGFSARFVSLSKRWQDEVIARHRLK